MVRAAASLLGKVSPEGGVAAPPPVGAFHHKGGDGFATQVGISKYLSAPATVGVAKARLLGGKMDRVHAAVTFMVHKGILDAAKYTPLLNAYQRGEEVPAFLVALLLEKKDDLILGAYLLYFRVRRGSGDDDGWTLEKELKRIASDRSERTLTSSMFVPLVDERTWAEVGPGASKDIKTNVVNMDNEQKLDFPENVARGRLENLCGPAMREVLENFGSVKLTNVINNNLALYEAGRYKATCPVRGVDLESMGRSYDAVMARIREAKAAADAAKDPERAP